MYKEHCWWVKIKKIVQRKLQGWIKNEESLKSIKTIHGIVQDGQEAKKVA